MVILCVMAIAALCAKCANFSFCGRVQLLARRIMKTVQVASAVTLVLFASGCAGLEFSPTPQPDALLYYDPAPYLQVTRGTDCSVTSSVITLPGQPRSVAFRSGYGSATLAVTLTGGMITSVNQATDTKIPDTINAIASLPKTLADIKALTAPPTAKPCNASVVLYPIVDGIPQRRRAISF
jgi:hypothetical protein